MYGVVIKTGEINEVIAGVDRWQGRQLVSGKSLEELDPGDPCCTSTCSEYSRATQSLS